MKEIMKKEVLAVTENKRYSVINREEPRGQSVADNGIPCTARHCCTNLNRLTEENEKIKNIIKEAYLNERTELGSNVLRQLAENLGIEI